MKNISTIPMTSPVSQLYLEDSRIITLTGAGGKTSFLYMLAQELSRQKQKTLVTTTTHIMAPTNLPGACLITAENTDALTASFVSGSLTALGIPQTSISQEEKWSSPSLSYLEEIVSVPDRILCEGDGSKRLPIKIPREKEPVFFPHTDTVVGIIGLSALNQPAGQTMFGLCDASVTYPALLPALQKSYGRVTPKIIEMIALSPFALRKHVTEEQNYHIVLNQADLLSERSLIQILQTAENIKNKGIFCHVISLNKKQIYQY